MIDLKSINKTLITSVDMFNKWVDPHLGHMSELIGFDIETDGVDFPKTKLAGFSLFSPLGKKACYVPINHVGGYNVLLEAIREKLQILFIYNTLVAHNGSYDCLIMSKLGFKFYNVIDSILISIALQFRNLGLKELVLEYGLAKYQDVTGFKKLMNKLGFPEDHSDFSVIDLLNNPEAVDYAVNDAIFAYYLAEILYAQYENHVGRATAGLNLLAQFDTMLLLSESGSKGVGIDKSYLDSFIKQYGGELKDLETKLMNQVRKEMGWGQIVQ